MNMCLLNNYKQYQSKSLYIRSGVYLNIGKNMYSIIEFYIVPILNSKLLSSTLYIICAKVHAILQEKLFLNSLYCLTIGRN